MTSRTASPLRRAAVFVDKDGTLIEDVPYNSDPACVRFRPNALRGLQQPHTPPAAAGLGA